MTRKEDEHRDKREALALAFSGCESTLADRNKGVLYQVSSLVAWSKSTLDDRERVIHLLEQERTQAARAATAILLWLDWFTAGGGK